MISAEYVVYIMCVISVDCRFVLCVCVVFFVDFFVIKIF